MELSKKASVEVKKDISGEGVASAEGRVAKITDWLFSIISPALVFSHGVYWTGASRGISLVVLLVREGLRGHRCITHRHTARKTNRARSSISEGGARDHFRLGPHGGERGRINAGADGRWNEAKIALGLKGRTAALCEKAPEVKQMSDLTAPDRMMKCQHKQVTTTGKGALLRLPAG